jgi:hypothetical protein
MEEGEVLTEDTEGTEDTEFFLVFDIVFGIP